MEVPRDSNTLVRLTLTSDALIMLAGTTPDLSKPLAMASAIMPAPIKPTRVLAMIKSDAMATTANNRLCITPNNTVNPAMLDHNYAIRARKQFKRDTALNASSYKKRTTQAMNNNNNNACS
jgi:hypothetical protein